MRLGLNQNQLTSANIFPRYQNPPRIPKERMGNLPVVHEVGTSFASLGDAITGHPEKARERWKNYAKESVVGSPVAGVVELCKNNPDKAEEYWKGMGRATGKAVLGGGFLRDVPVFHELAVCGESLGDVIGGGDTKSAEKRWETYVESSVIGGGIAAIAAKIDGDDEKAEKLIKGCGKATLRFGVTAAGVAATAVTGGLAAPYGVAASVATGATVGGVTGAGSTALVQVIDKGKVDDAGAIVGSGLFGGVVGGVSEGIAAAKRADVKAKTQVNGPKRVKANSESWSTSSEADFFPQHPEKQVRRNSFSFKGGKARRNSEFPDVWSPKDPGKKADVKAAAQAAKRDIQQSLKGCSKKTRPGKTSVIQDAKGNAYGTSSVRGPKRADLKETLSSKQSRVLDSIPEETRGVGHGNCAEQVAVNNTRYFRQKTNNKLFGEDSKIKVQAFAQAKGLKGVYNVPVKPCGSCQVVLNEFGIKHSATKSIPVASDQMAQMIAAGLTVGCKACQGCQEKKE